jgi:diguanylate cyclase (GGDEF)-like protein
MPTFLGKSPFLRVIFALILILLVYFILPVYLAKILSLKPFKPLFLFYLINIFILLYFSRKSFLRSYDLQLRIQGFQEKINILNAEYSQEIKKSIALLEKSMRYNSLGNILKEINSSLELDSVAEILTSEVFSLIGKNKGVCVLYLIDNQTQKLVLFKTKKGDKGLVIKTKEGNTLDFWVLRHASPLLVEDIKNDFRFDLDKLLALDARPVASLISSPFLSENKQLGILRLDSEIPGAYSQDDLRFLASISDLGAVAIENSELFKRAQDLAIHDVLTGLYTKVYFMERFKEECKRALSQKTPLSLLMLDIDFFKNYNDQFGHTAGDIVLKKLSQIITKTLASLHPLISRFGGEEFCIAITGKDKKEAYKIGDYLRREIENEKVILRRSETHITTSVGLASLPVDALDDEDLIRKADKAMYEAKQKGRNQVCSF